MVILFSSLLGALGSVHDREFGSMRMLLISPMPRGVIVLGKTISSTLLGVSFAVALSPLAWLFQVHMGFLQYLEFLGAALLTGLALSSLGMLVASRMKRLENFAVVMNFVIFPMFFLSGALYLTNDLPDYLQPLVRFNPLTYGVDLMRHAMLSQEPLTWSRVEFGALFDVGYLCAFTVFALAMATMLFGGEEHLSAIFLSQVPRRVPFLKRLAISHPASLHLRRRSLSSVPTATPALTPEPAGSQAGGVSVAIRGALSSVISREFKRATRQRGVSSVRSPGPLSGWLRSARASPRSSRVANITSI